jgi:hypothetical protein
MEAGHVDVETRAIQAADEFCHLPLGTAGMEARDEHGCRNWGTRCHLMQPAAT